MFGSNAFVIRSGIPVVSAFCSRKRSPLSRWGVLANAARARNVAPGPHFPRRHAHGIGGTGQWPNRRWRWSNLEPMTGIELAYSAWEAISSAERPFYRGCSRALSADPNPEDTCVFGTFGTLSRPVRPWFGGVRGTHGVPPANSAGSGNPNPYPVHAHRCTPRTIVQPHRARTATVLAATEIAVEKWRGRNFPSTIYRWQSATLESHLSDGHQVDDGRAAWRRQSPIRSSTARLTNRRLTSRSVHTARRASWSPGDDQANRSSQLHSHERHERPGKPNRRPSTSTSLANASNATR